MKNMDFSFWQTIGSVTLGAMLTFFMTVITDCLRNRREEKVFNRRKRLEAYLEVFKILNDYLAHLDAMKTDPILYREFLLKINRMNVLNGIFASKRFERAIKKYVSLTEKGNISIRDRESFLNVMRQDLGLPLLGGRTHWQRFKLICLFRFKCMSMKIRSRCFSSLG